MGIRTREVSTTRAKISYYFMLVQNRILTAEPLRARRIYFLFGGGRYRQTRTCSCRAFLGPLAVGKYLASVPAGRRFLIPSLSPDGIRKNSHSGLSATQR